KLSLTFILCFGVIILRAHAQDTVQTQRPLFFQVDFAVGGTQRGSGYFSTIARFYHEKSFISAGTGGFVYTPGNLPPGFDAGALSTNHTNSLNLYFAGYGTFLPSAHRPSRI